MAPLTFRELDAAITDAQDRRDWDEHTVLNGIKLQAAIDRADPATGQLADESAATLPPLDCLPAGARRFIEGRRR